MRCVHNCVCVLAVGRGDVEGGGRIRVLVWWLRAALACLIPYARCAYSCLSAARDPSLLPPPAMPRAQSVRPTWLVLRRCKCACYHTLPCGGTPRLVEGVQQCGVRGRGAALSRSAGAVRSFLDRSRTPHPAGVENFKACVSTLCAVLLPCPAGDCTEFASVELGVFDVYSRCTLFMLIATV